MKQVETPESDAPDEVERTFIPIHVKDCLTCNHLVGHARTFKDNCHFTRGNDNCPAKHIKIGVGVNYEAASDAISGAIMNGDIVALTRHVNKLSKYDSEVGSQVLDHVRQKVFFCMAEQGYTVAEEGEDDAADSADEAEELDTSVDDGGSDDDDLAADAQSALRTLPSDLDDDDTPAEDPTEATSTEDDNEWNE